MQRDNSDIMAWLSEDEDEELDKKEEPKKKEKKEEAVKKAAEDTSEASQQRSVDKFQILLTENDRKLLRNHLSLWGTSSYLWLSARVAVPNHDPSVMQADVTASVAGNVLTCSATIDGVPYVTTITV